MGTATLWGRTYNTVDLPDGKTWFAENLAATNFQDGLGDIGQWWLGAGTDNGAGRFYPASAYARLMAALPSGFRPAWRSDWEGLRDTLPAETKGAILRQMGTTWWRAPNSDATDQYGFACLGAGRRSNSYTWENRLDAAHFWAFPEGNLSDLRFAYLFANSPGFFDVWPASTNELLNIRLIVDTPTPVAHNVHIPHSGAWVKPGAIWVPHGGAWKEVLEVHVAQGGAWKRS